MKAFYNTSLEFSRLVISEKFITDFGYYYLHIWGKPEKTKSQPDKIVDYQFNEISEFYKSFNYNLLAMIQVHGTNVVYADNNLLEFQPEADAIYSREKNLALSVKTADCMPIFFFNNQNLNYGIIHAGWRGLNDKIFKKTMDEILFKKIDKLQNFHFIVGPHIHAQNYETSEDVYLKFSESCSLPTGKENKRFLDMEQILHTQIADKGIKKENCHWLNSNTFQSGNFYSHRSGDLGRNFNIIFFAEKDLF